MCSANAQGRSPEGAIEWERRGKEREADTGQKVGEGERNRVGKAGKGREGQGKRRRGGEGGSSQAALYPDRSPLHTNFLVKEEKMALNL